MAPDLLFHPVLDEAEALTGVSDGEVIHPATQHRMEQLPGGACTHWKSAAFARRTPGAVIPRCNRQ